MSYSLDLRKLVVNYVNAGGSVTKASQIYQVGRTTIYQWLKRENLLPTPMESRHRKLDWEALKKADARIVRFPHHEPLHCAPSRCSAKIQMLA